MSGLCLMSGLKGASCTIPNIPEPQVHVQLPFQRSELFPTLMAILREGELPHVLYPSKKFAGISLILKPQAKRPNWWLEWHTDLLYSLFLVPKDRSSYRFPELSILFWTDMASGYSKELAGTEHRIWPQRVIQERRRHQRLKSLPSTSFHPFLQILLHHSHTLPVRAPSQNHGGLLLLLAVTERESGMCHWARARQPLCGSLRSEMAQHVLSRTREVWSQQ